MNIIPAIDIKNGECVRLTQGKSDSVTTYNQDPIKQAKIFELNGCERIHIVDLDAAITNNKKNNINAINNIKKNTSLKIQLGGGIRSYEQANYWISSGIEYLIIGSMAMENPTETIKIIEGFENKIFIGVDEKDNQLMIKGWTEKTNLTINIKLKIVLHKSIISCRISNLET